MVVDGGAKVVDREVRRGCTRGKRSSWPLESATVGLSHSGTELSPTAHKLVESRLDRTGVGGREGHHRHLRLVRRRRRRRRRRGGGAPALELCEEPRLARSRRPDNEQQLRIIERRHLSASSANAGSSSRGAGSSSASAGAAAAAAAAASAASAASSSAAAAAAVPLPAAAPSASSAASITASRRFRGRCDSDGVPAVARPSSRAPAPALDDDDASVGGGECFADGECFLAARRRCHTASCPPFFRAGSSSRTSAAASLQSMHSMEPPTTPPVVDAAAVGGAAWTPSSLCAPGAPGTCEGIIALRLAHPRAHLLLELDENEVPLRLLAGDAGRHPGKLTWSCWRKLRPITKNCGPANEATTSEMQDAKRCPQAEPRAALPSNHAVKFRTSGRLCKRSTNA